MRGKEDLPRRQQQTTITSKVKTARNPIGRSLSEVSQFTQLVLGLFIYISSKNTSQWLFLSYGCHFSFQVKDTAEQRKLRNSLSGYHSPGWYSDLERTREYLVFRAF